MKKDKNNNQSIIDEIIGSLDIKDNNKKMKEQYINKKQPKKGTYINTISKDVKEEYEIIMDCNRSDYFVYYKKK